MSLNNAPEGCLGPGQGDKGALSPSEPPDICQVTLIQRQNVEAAQCKAEWRGLLTETWRTMERSESSKGEEAEKGPDNSCSWRKLLRTNAQGQEETRGGGCGGEKSLFWESSIMCTLDQKSLPVQRGSPTCCGSLERILFLLPGLGKLPVSSVSGHWAPSATVS